MTRTVMHKMFEFFVQRAEAMSFFPDTRISKAQPIRGGPKAPQFAWRLNPVGLSQQGSFQLCRWGQGFSRKPLFEKTAGYRQRARVCRGG
ncbi:hypothetical protein L0F63_007032 [Massospora cicadina]|nr:hypothetical protein L0F63_007032 [Massospora cicadina]